jgi:eukaryotic-like serine/threonine-protein kinase
VSWTGWPCAGNNRRVATRRLDLTAGARLDRYELMFPLAEGGMAAVWLARLRGKRGFEQLVAIKTIKEHLSEDVRFEEMFLDEARIASRIRHPNVGQILDLGEESGVLYLVMEWIDGESLSRTRRAVEKRGAKIPLPLALRIMADVAGGLHAAHELKDESGANLGVIHRDVSPQNILVANSGTVKLIDFGIAKARNRAVAETTDGLVKGKVAYMSPEQADGLPVDRRSDVWAVGVCLYELLTGKLPFDGESQQEILRLLVKGTDVPPLPSTIPAVVRGVVRQALTRDPAGRFLTAAALERALEGALVSLDALTTSDDLAKFLRETCPERAKARSEVLASVERITESLDGPVTRDVTPPAKGASDSVDVRFSEPGRAPPEPTEVPMEPAEVATLHSASVSKPVAERESVAPRSRGAVVGAAILALGLGIGGTVVVLRRPNVAAPSAPVVAPVVATSSEPSVLVPPTPASATAAVPATTPPPPPPPSTRPPPAVTGARPRPPPPRASVGATSSAKPAPAPGYDSDGIPIATPKGGGR